MVLSIRIWYKEFPEIFLIMHKILTGATTSIQSELWRNINEGILHSSQGSTNGTSQSDRILCHTQYIHFFERSYPSTLDVISAL